MKSNKTIGIVGWSTGDASFGVSKPYLEYFKMFSDNVIVLTPNSFIPNLDLLVLPGGKDVLWGGGGDYSFYNSDAERFLEHFDKYTLPKYIEAQTPIYGICRGMQTLVRHFGGILEQNLGSDHGYSKDTDDLKANKLRYEKNYELLSKATTFVGSWHHQGCAIYNLPEEFDLVASTGGIVEFARHKTLPIIIEQSHPERNFAEIETIFIKELLKIKDDNEEL